MQILAGMLPPIAEDWISRVHVSHYFPNEAKIVSTQKHGFSDASERLRWSCLLENGGQYRECTHLTSCFQNKGCPVLTISCLELCGAHLLEKLLHHVRSTLNIPVDTAYAWTNSSSIGYMAIHVASEPT